MLGHRLKGSLKGLLARRDGGAPRRPPDHDPFEAQRRLLLGHRVGTVVDVGAFVGDASARYRSLFPDATVYSFEPFADAYARLEARFRKDEFVRPQQLAMAERVGAVEVRVDGEIATAADESPSPPPGAAGEGSGSDAAPPAADAEKTVAGAAAATTVERISITTLDAFCRERNLAGIDLLRLDLLGDEAAALRGAGDLLGRKAVMLIYAVGVAFVPQREREGGALFHDVAGLLAGYGYGVYNLYGLNHGESGQLESADALFVSPEIRRRAIDDPSP